MRKFIIALCLISLFSIFHGQAYANTDSTWKYQCIDTMKYSRDRAREYESLNVDNINEINFQMKLIKSLGANCVAIDTPYDEEFYPVLKKWADIAHSNGLSVWFRGNWSGWEGWFNYPKNFTRNRHLSMTSDFILNHPDLFRNGDSFTACPECEYGGPGNPLSTGDYSNYRKFIIDEKRTVDNAFRSIGLSISTNRISMNPDVAKAALDEKTVMEMGNAITLDSYYKSSASADEEINYFANKFPETKIFVGEFGAPVPGLNGNLSEQEQTSFINGIYNDFFVHRNNIAGTNYWVLKGGTTAIVNDDNSTRSAAMIIKKYYLPYTVSGYVSNTLTDKLQGAAISTSNGIRTTTDSHGRFSFTTPDKDISITISSNSYIPQLSVLGSEELKFTLAPEHPDLIYRFRSAILKQFGIHL